MNETAINRYNVYNKTTQEIERLSSCDMEPYFHRDYTQITAVTSSIVVIYILIIILALFGNGLVISTVWRNANMHTVTNYYIVNLAISDFLVACIVMPMKLMEYTTPCRWQVFASDWLCSVVYYLLPIFVFVSILTLMAISIERYYAIVHPLSAMKMSTKSRTRKIIASTWIIPIICASPYTYCRRYPFVIKSGLGQISRQICNDRFDEIDIMLHGTSSGQFRKGFFLFLCLTFYVLPMLVIVCTCTKIAICLLRPIIVTEDAAGRRACSRKHEENKRKVAKMIIVVAIAFIISWSPQFIVTIVSQFQQVSFLRRENFLFTMLMTHLFGFVNSCINPFIYTIMSEKFRRSFIQIMSCIFLCCFTRNGIKSTHASWSYSLSPVFSSTRRQTSSCDIQDTPLSDCQEETYGH